MKVFTLVIIQRGNDVLLGMKKQGFGTGRWNGFGGKVELNESIEDAARREVTEEAGVLITDLEKRGVITFTFEHNDDELEVHIFRSTDFTGEPTESDEMRPQWFARESIPYSEMWKDDRIWLPILLDNKPFGGRVHFTADHEIVRHDIAVTG